MLSKLILCYLTDKAALGTVTLFTKNELPDGHRCVVDDVANEFKGRGLVRLGHLYAPNTDKDGQRIVLVFLQNGADAASMIERLNRYPQNTILVATAAEIQRSELAKRNIDTRRGYAEIYDGRPPYIDLPNALLITDESRNGSHWYRELAGALIRNFLYPQSKVVERKRTPSPEAQQVEAT